MALFTKRIADQLSPSIARVDEQVRLFRDDDRGDLRNERSIALRPGGAPNQSKQALAVPLPSPDGLSTRRLCACRNTLRELRCAPDGDSAVADFSPGSARSSRGRQARSSWRNRPSGSPIPAATRDLSAFTAQIVGRSNPGVMAAIRHSTASLMSKRRFASVPEGQKPSAGLRRCPGAGQVCAHPRLAAASRSTGDPPAGIKALRVSRLLHDGFDLADQFGNAQSALALIWSQWSLSLKLADALVGAMPMVRTTYFTVRPSSRLSLVRISDGALFDELHSLHGPHSPDHLHWHVLNARPIIHQMVSQVSSRPYCEPGLAGRGSPGQVLIAIGDPGPSRGARRHSGLAIKLTTPNSDNLHLRRPLAGEIEDQVPVMFSMISDSDYLRDLESADPIDPCVMKLRRRVRSTVLGGRPAAPAARLTSSSQSLRP